MTIEEAIEKSKQFEWARFVVRSFDGCWYACENNPEKTVRNHEFFVEGRFKEIHNSGSHVVSLSNIHAIDDLGDDDCMNGMTKCVWCKKITPNYDVTCVDSLSGSECACSECLGEVFEEDQNGH